MPSTSNAGYYCRQCGQYHAELPLSYDSPAPANWYDVPEGDRARRTVLGSDNCIIDNQLFFVKGNIELPIRESDQVFAWSVWLSLSHTNYQRAEACWNQPGRESEPPYFGWLNTALPVYPTTINLKTHVHSRPVGQRFVVQLEPTDHPLAIEQRTGITWERVQQIAEKLLHANFETEPSPEPNRTAASASPLSFRAAWQFAWSAYRQYLGLFTALMLLMLAAWVVLEVLVIAGQSLGIVWWAVAHASFLVTFAGLEAALVSACLDLAWGGRSTLAGALRQGIVAPQFLAGQVMYLVIVAIGLALLIVPGLLWASRYSLYGIGIVKGARAWPSFEHSADIIAGRWPRMLGLLGGLLLFNLLGACLLGLGLLVTVPVSALALAAVYQQLAGLTVTLTPPARRR